MQLSLQRIFVGNLPTDVTENEIAKRFSKYGKVQSTEIKHRPDSSTFAYLNLEASAQNIDECFKVLPKKKWGGNHVTVQIAKESFLSRLSKERQQAASAHEQSVVNNGTSFVKTEDDGNTEDTSMGNVTSKNKRVRIHDSSPKFDAKEDPSTSFTIVESFRNETKNNKLICDMNGEVLEQSCAVVERLSSGASIADGRTVDKNSGDFKKKKKRISDCISTCNPDVENETSDIKLISEVSSDDEVEYNKKLPMFRGTMNISMTDEEQSKEVRTKLHKRKKNIITADRLQDARYSDGDHFYEKDRINEKKKLQKGINSVHNLNVEHRKESSIKTTISEEKRKKSIEDKRKSFKNQIQAVKRSLAAVDVPLNKKIVFNDEEEQDGLDENKDYIQDKSSELQSSEHDNQKTTLFESESSDYEPDDFKIKSQFEGRKGQKLLELQTKYANDKRFRLDERFYDSDDEKSKNNITTLENEDEKQHHLKILKDVLGQDVLLTDDKKEKERKKSMLRFDPSKMDYKKFSLPTPEPKQVCEHDSKEVNKFSKTVKNAESKDVETRENNAPKIEVSKEKYYKVTDALKETLLDKSKRSGGFSLLEMFGPGDDSSKGEMPDYQSTTVSKKKQIGWTKNPFKYDSSESESEETEPKKSLYQEPEDSETVVSSRRVETFFFTKDDPRLKEGITFFTTKQYVDENEFAKRRRELKLIIKSKVKNNLKKKQPWKRKLGGQKKKFTRRK